MLNIILLSVVLGLATAAPQVFPLETAVNQAARDDFMIEFNRLAALAAAAPDIHIYTADRRLDNPNVNVIPHHQAPAVQHHRPAVQHHRPAAPAFNNQQFVPQAPTFPAAPQHTAGHLAGQEARHQIRPQPSNAPIIKWDGPFAHDIPADVFGPPTQFLDNSNVNVIPHHQAPAVQHHRPAVQHHRPAAPAFNNQQFVPQAPTFPAAPQRSAGHLVRPDARHQIRPQPSNEPIIKWDGPFAHEVGAGVEGPVTQVLDTPLVADAKAAHYATLIAAYEAAPRPSRF